MKIKETWKTIQSFFKIDPLALDSQELTDDRVQQINDQLGSVTLQNEQLKEQLAAEKFAFQMTLAELEALKQQDAATEIVAVKDADKIESIADEPVYAHDKIADEFCS